MTLAARAREAARAHPFVHEGLRAGVINYSAAARLLDVGDEEAVAAALRRYAAELPERDIPDGSPRVTMHSGLGAVEHGDGGLLTVGETTYAENAGSLTGVAATGTIDARSLVRVLARLDAEDVAVEAAAVADGYLVLVVDRRDGPDVVRFVEAMI
ncbi:conserved hypothetical protein [Halorhabdus utahensis DSM 12940]|uniref:Uncharacterized protein n=1 Tax=Halorhabdus utahensis (strain DSM 12940 / JCM 11049 / AX-2) TaxID=519442 RepID=C7NNL2_HALUD|nr:hypothetical protein [Halorhabdus utahensis]ACV10240.1 conserved hypothetical protein [Halorhabdus utahensis DSM 12940]